jgi:glycosyltransferase involved in cell wall biosynthesis
VLTPGENGLLASNEEEWAEGLRSLVENPQRRTQIGASARDFVLRRYAPEIRTAELAQILPRLLDAREDNVATRA